MRWAALVLFMVALAAGCGRSSSESFSTGSQDRASCREWWNDHAPSRIKRFLTTHGFSRAVYGPSTVDESINGGPARRTVGCSYSFYTAGLQRIDTVAGVLANETMTFRRSAPRPINAPDKFDLQHEHPFALQPGAQIPNSA